MKTDFRARTLVVSSRTIGWPGITPADGLDVEFWMGSRVAVQHSPVRATRTGYIDQR